MLCFRYLGESSPPLWAASAVLRQKSYLTETKMYFHTLIDSSLRYELMFFYIKLATPGKRQHGYLQCIVICLD